MKQIVLIGAGNVATHLARAIDQSYPRGTLSHIYSRRHSSALELGQQLSYCPVCMDNLQALPTSADLYLFCTPDDSLEALWHTMPATHGGLWAHTAGSVPLDKMMAWHSECGVLYPLQTLSKARSIDPRELPLYIEGSDEEVAARLESFARSLSGCVYRADSQQRGHLHLAAVLACNFTNHLLALSEDYLKRHDLDPKALYPLVRETMAKAELYNPRSMQTGPAIRGDEETMNRHLELIQEDLLLSQIYRLLSESIRRHSR